MKEQHLIILSFLFSLAGILSLYLISENLDYDKMSIEKINNEKTKDMVKLNGRIEKVSDTDNITFITISQSSYIDVVIFDKINLTKGEGIEIIGQSEEYKNKMEIIAHKIRVID